MEQYFEILPFNSQLILELFLLIVLLFLSATVSGAEAACFSLSQNDLEKFKERNSKSDQIILQLLHKQDYLLATILIANNLVNIGAVIVSNQIIDISLKFHSFALEFVVKMVVVTFILLLFGEIMPKIIATSNAANYVKNVAPFLNSICKIFKPFAYILIKSGGAISSTMSRKKNPISIDDLSQAIQITDSENIEDKRILKGIVRFVSTEVSDVMCPRIDAVVIEQGDDFDTLKELIIKSGFSRIPVCRDEKDQIIGVIYAKDLVAHIENDNFKWQTLIRKPFYVPEHKKINDLLEEFQTKKMHFAIVVDEYGAMQGIVSLEDILEEIVGEISDESDKHHVPYIKVAPNVYIFDGKSHVADLIKLFECSDDYFDQERGDAETLAGLMLEHKRDFLAKGDTITINDFTLSVVSIEGRRADKIKVERNV